jgi:galactose mutarotase-like enzyme
MYFSVGGHPAFKVPLVYGTTYTDYYLEFNNDKSLPRWPISAAGLIENKSLPVLSGTSILPLTKELFFKDALVFKHPASSVVSLRSAKTNHGLDFNISAFPYLGIWAAKNADFVCIEPWCGIADSVDADQQLIHKEGINKLNAGEIFERSWNAAFF